MCVAYKLCRTGALRIKLRAVLSLIENNQYRMLSFANSPQIRKRSTIVTENYVYNYHHTGSLYPIMSFSDYSSDSEKHFPPSLVAIKSGYCQTTRIDLFLSRRLLDEEINDLLSIVAKFFGKLFNWIRLTTLTRLLLVFVSEISFKKRKPVGFQK